MAVALLLLQTLCSWFSFFLSPSMTLLLFPPSLLVSSFLKAQQVHQNLCCFAAAQEPDLIPDLILPGVLPLVVRLRGEGGGRGQWYSARLPIVPQHLLEYRCWLDICCKHFLGWSAGWRSSPFTGSNDLYCFIAVSEL